MFVSLFDPLNLLLIYFIYSYVLCPLVMPCGMRVTLITTVSIFDQKSSAINSYLTPIIAMDRNSHEGTDGGEIVHGGSSGSHVGNTVERSRSRNAPRPHRADAASSSSTLSTRRQLAPNARHNGPPPATPDPGVPNTNRVANTVGVHAVPGVPDTNRVPNTNFHIVGVPSIVGGPPSPPSPPISSQTVFNMPFDPLRIAIVGMLPGTTVTADGQSVVIWMPGTIRRPADDNTR